MTFDEALEYLHSLIDFEKLGAVYFGRDRFQLAGTRRLLAGLGDPQARLRVIHLAGTKGKGSTAAMVDAILRDHGRRVGLSTKPHLVDIRERTRVDGRLIGREEFAAVVARVRPLVEQINAEPEQDPTTFYEAHLAASLLFFAEEGVDFAIMETGLGGRLDATNALSPVVCAITRIDYDHTEILGDDLTDIAREKAGIIKPGVPCVLAPQAPEVSAVIEAQAASVGAPIIACPAVEAESSGDHFTVRAGQVYGDLRLPLPGRHQRENAAVALGVVEALADFGVRPEPERVRAALETLRWPGRFQVLPGRPTVVLDVAHNAVSARALREDLERLAAEQPEAPAVILVVGMARDKDLAAFAATLFPLAAQVLCTGAHSPRAAAPEAFAEAGKRAGVAPRIVATVPEALAEARSLARPQDVICITGSFHVVGEAMEALGVEP